jgi:hypothetical protein
MKRLNSDATAAMAIARLDSRGWYTCAVNSTLVTLPFPLTILGISIALLSVSEFQPQPPPGLLTRDDVSLEAMRWQRWNLVPFPSASTLPPLGSATTAALLLSGIVSKRCVQSLALSSRCVVAQLSAHSVLATVSSSR